MHDVVFGGFFGKLESACRGDADQYSGFVRRSRNHLGIGDASVKTFLLVSSKTNSSVLARNRRIHLQRICVRLLNGVHHQHTSMKASPKPTKGKSKAAAAKQSAKPKAAAAKKTAKPKAVAAKKSAATKQATEVKQPTPPAEEEEDSSGVEEEEEEDSSEGGGRDICEFCDAHPALKLPCYRGVDPAMKVPLVLHCDLSSVEDWGGQQECSKIAEATLQKTTRKSVREQQINTAESIS